MQLTKPEWKWLSVAVCAALLLGAQSTLGAAASNWDTIEAYGNVSYAPAADGSITVTFGNASGADRRTALIGADFGGAMGSDLSGMAKLAFRVVGDGTQPLWAAVVIDGAGLTWKRPFTISPVDGEATLVEALLDLSDGWEWTGGSADTQDRFDAALAAVDHIGIRLDQNGTSAQSYNVGGFALLDDAGASIPATMSALQSELWATFRVTSADALTEEQLAADSDEDGATDLAVIGFGGNPIVEVVASDSGGTTIKFECTSDALYSIYRDDDLSDDVGYTFVETVIPAASGAMEYLDEDANDGGPYFYKVIANRE
jgi:hypothetical protein